MWDEKDIIASKNEETRECLKTKIEEYLNKEAELHEIDGKWEKYKKAISTPKSKIFLRSNTKLKPWTIEEIINMMGKRRNIFSFPRGKLFSCLRSNINYFNDSPLDVFCPTLENFQLHNSLLLATIS